MEFALLQTTLLQWCYANAKAEEALSKQTKSAEQQLHSATRHLLALHDDTILKKRQLFEDKHSRYLDDVVDEQYAALIEETEDVMQQMMRSYNVLSDALSVNMRRMPVHGVATIPRDARRQQGAAAAAVVVASIEDVLASCCADSENQLASLVEDILAPVILEPPQEPNKEEAEEKLVVHSQHTTTTAAGGGGLEMGIACADRLKELENTTASEMEELERTKSLLGQFVKLENEERSLCFQQLLQQHP